MELITPDIGLLFWMLLSFSIVLVLLKRFAWKPILTALKNREEGIETALAKAEEARKEISETNTRVSEMLSQGKLEKEKMLKIAREDIADYKKKEHLKIGEQIKTQLNSVTEEINQQKRAALDELKKSVAELSIEIAEKILKKELENENSHNELINDSIKNLEIK